MLQATRLGTVTSAVTLSNLQMRDSADWFEFRLLGAPANRGYVTLNFQHSQGDIDVQLYTPAGQLLRSSTGTGNTERISLSGLEAGRYLIKVYGYRGAENPNYSMTVDPIGGVFFPTTEQATDSIFEQIGAESRDRLSRVDWL